MIKAMKNPTQISILTNLLCWSLFLITFLTIAGCSSSSSRNSTPTEDKYTALAFPPKTTESSDPIQTPKPKEQKDIATSNKKVETKVETKAETKVETKTKVKIKKKVVIKEENTRLDEAFSAATDVLLLTPVIALSSTTFSSQGAPTRSKKQPDGVNDFCNVKPYAEHEKQVKNGIKTAWDTKIADEYGVGFRNIAEYNKWNNTQKDFFLFTFDACRSLALCEIDNKKNKKNNACFVQQVTFDAWQDSAKLFTNEVKKFRTQQPAALCSIQPNNGDVSLCFKQRAKQINDVCDADVCKELSQCWASVAIKDDVVRQAESSCRFSGQKLSTCRGHIEAMEHRKNRFIRCNKMQNNLDLVFQP